MAYSFYFHTKLRSCFKTPKQDNFSPPRRQDTKKIFLFSNQNLRFAFLGVLAVKEVLK